MRRSNFALFLLLGLSLLLPAVTTEADGLIRDGLGARVAGRGGVNIGYSDAGTILHDNPAGMVRLEGGGLDEMGADVILTDIKYSDPSGVASSDGDPLPLGNISLIRKSSDGLWAYGLGMFSTGGFATDYVMQGPAPLTGLQKYKSFGSLARILPGVSVQATDALTIGGTLGVGVSHVELEGPYFLQTSLPGVPTLMDVQATGAALTWSLGLQYELSPWTSVGATYQSETQFHLDGKTSTVVPGLGASEFDTTLDMVWPRSLGLGVRHAFCDHQVGGIDLIYYNWDQAFDNAGLYLSNASNPAFQGFGPLTEIYPLQWRDTLSVRIGFERELANSDVVRFGFVHHRNPIPANTLTPYIVTTVEHTLSVGYGTQISGYEVDLGYQFMFAGTQKVGTSDFLGGDFDNSQVRTQAHLVYISFLRRR